MSYLRICDGESLDTTASATSQAFFVIRGSGVSSSEHGDISWDQGDLFVLPVTHKPTRHSAKADTAIYWVTDEPLLTYLGVTPTKSKFRPTLFKRDTMLREVEAVKHQEGAEHRNRLGILLANKVTENSTKTLSHVLWSLLNTLPAKNAQRPHRHNSCAVDLCVSAPESGVYTLMGPELDESGWVKNPVKCDWRTGN